MVRAVVFDCNINVRGADISWTRRAFSKSFIAIFDPSAAFNPATRLRYIDAGASMVAHDVSSIVTTLRKSVLYVGTNGGSYECPYCNFYSLTLEELRDHMPVYHINCPRDVGSVSCPICRKDIYKPLQVHIHDDHGPNAGRNSGDLDRPSFYGFALVMCRHPPSGTYLMCQEFAGQGFWLPGGAVDPGETFSMAAVRETKEEAGIDVELKGILAVEHSPQREHTRDSYVKMRVIFYAEPRDPTQLPKSVPDFESAGACWCSRDQIEDNLKLRGSEPKYWCSYLEQGGDIFPLSMLREKV